MHSGVAYARIYWRARHWERARVGHPMPAATPRERSAVEEICRRANAKNSGIYNFIEYLTAAEGERLIAEWARRPAKVGKVYRPAGVR